MMHILQTLTQAMPFAEIFKHGDLSVELYQPVGEDLQQPHERDEIYLIISGEGVSITTVRAVHLKQAI